MKIQQWKLLRIAVSLGEKKWQETSLNLVSTINYSISYLQIMGRNYCKKQPSIGCVETWESQSEMLLPWCSKINASNKYPIFKLLHHNRCTFTVLTQENWWFSINTDSGIEYTVEQDKMLIRIHTNWEVFYSKTWSKKQSTLNNAKNCMTDKI